MLILDLFEHLSLEGLEAALDEVFRVARRGLVLNFFNLEDISRHVPKPVAERRYHWNTLSLKLLTASLAARSTALDLVHVRGMACERFRPSGTVDSFLHDLNPNLFTCFVTK